nr:unnamed protein product [Amyelois transitella]
MIHFSSDGPIEVKQKKRLSDESNWNKKHEKIGRYPNKFVEFCKRTDLHGYKYIVMEELSSFERGCWAFAVVVSIVVAVYFVVTAYMWYARNPIVTVIESTQGAIWDVPFPAITICDQNAISRKAARHFADTVTLPPNISADNIFEITRLAPLLYSGLGVTNKQKEDLRALQKVLDLNNFTVDNFFRQLFKTVFTVVNLCCTFNYFAVEDSEKKEPAKSKNEYSTEDPPKPRRVASCGYQTALTVLLNTDPNDYYSAVVGSQGFIVFVDDAYNVPDLDSPARLINPFTEVLIALSPERTYATNGIKYFSPEQRQCYYNNEFDSLSRRRSIANVAQTRNVKISSKSIVI